MEFVWVASFAVQKSDAYLSLKYKTSEGLGSGKAYRDSTIGLEHGEWAATGKADTH